MRELHNLNHVLGDTEDFIDRLTDEVIGAGFDIKDFVQLDHICYRTETVERYEEIKRDLGEFGLLMTETEVNGRPISTFHLFSPIKTNQWTVPAVELPAPKTGAHYPDGLEHGEFVLRDPLEMFLEKYSDVEFDMRAADRGLNPEVGLKLPNGMGAKFHLLSLTAVTQLEKLHSITSVNDGDVGLLGSS